MITVEKPIKLLQKQPPKSVVILSSDAEGNRYTPCDDSFGTALWDEGSREILDEEDEDGEAAVILYPE